MHRCHALAALAFAGGCTMVAEGQLFTGGVLEANVLVLDNGAMSGDDVLLEDSRGAFRSEASVASWSPAWLCVDLALRTTHLVSRTFDVTMESGPWRRVDRWNAGACDDLSCLPPSSPLRPRPADDDPRVRIHAGRLCAPDPPAPGTVEDLTLTLRQGVARFRWRWRLDPSRRP